MLSLIIDTALGYMGIAIGEDAQILASLIISKPITVTTIGIKAIDLLLSSINKKKKDIGEVVVSGGPGTFTSLRVGISLAKGICMALGIPIVPVSTLDAMALTMKKCEGIIVPVIDGKNNNMYVAEYVVHDSVVEKILDASLINADSISKNKSKFSSNVKGDRLVTVVGIDIEKYIGVLKMLYTNVRSFEVLDITQMVKALHYISNKRLYNVQPVSPVEYTPIYLREPDVKIKTKSEE